LTEKSDPSIYGQWEPIREKYKFNFLPVHMALLYTGKVLSFGGSGNDPEYLNSPHRAGIFEPGEIDKDDGKVYPISNEGIEGDIFCSGHVSLPDGKILVAGGTSKYDGSSFGIPLPPFSGLDQTYLFDPTSLSWKRLRNMKYARWYPTCIMMADGRVVVMAGLTDMFPWAFLNKLEIFNHDHRWETLKADHWLPLYPRLHLLPTGLIFYAGSFNTHYTFPFNVRLFPSATLDVNNGKWTIIGNPDNVKREEGTTVLMPMTPADDYAARVLLIAGGTSQGNDAIKKVEIIDFSKDIPKYVEFQPLKHPRYYVYPIILPDRSILVLGGKSGKKGHLHEDQSDHRHHPEGEQPHHPDAVMEPELLDPETNEWRPMADMKVDRLYHSNALLLPDGRVITAGSNPQRTMNELRIEIFRPPYLFRGKRPVIDKYAKELHYGKTFEIESSDAEAIKEICLIRPSVTTHCVNTEQRYVGLEFSKSLPKTLQTSIPSNRNLAPPGYYMLFIVTEDRVPSVAKFVLLS
jgi:hypothetical protein